MKEQTSENPEKGMEEKSEVTEEQNQNTQEEALPADEADTLAAENEQLRAQVEQLKKEYLLARADLENFRKRTLKEKAELIKNGGETCLKDILPVIDDFERGLQAVSESSDIEAVKHGIELIYNKFRAYLDRHGVKRDTNRRSQFRYGVSRGGNHIPGSDTRTKRKSDRLCAERVHVER